MNAILSFDNRDEVLPSAGVIIALAPSLTLILPNSAEPSVERPAKLGCSLVVYESKPPVFFFTTAGPDGSSENPSLNGSLLLLPIHHRFL